MRAQAPAPSPSNDPLPGADALPRGPGAPWAPFALGALLVAAFARRAPEVVVDTATYLEHAIHRTPGYPLFLDAMRLLGGAHQLKAAQIAQLIIGALCALDLAATLRRAFRLPGWLAAGLQVALFFPQVRYGQIIATESLSHSLFLLLLSLLTRSFFQPMQRHVLGTAGTLLALVLLRPQFVFLFPLAVLYLLWLFFGRRQLRANLAAAAAFALCLSASVLAQAVHNYAYHGRFARIPFTGMQVAAVVLYLAEPADAALMPDEVTRRYFSEAMRMIEERGWHARHRPPHQSYFDHFNAMYANIYLEAVVPGFQRLTGRAALGPDDWVAFDRLTLGMSLRLLLRHPRQLAFHVLKQMQETAGYLPLLMGLCVVLPFLLYRRTASAGALSLMAVALMGLLNYLLVALLEPLGTRYTMYTEHVLLPFLVAFCVHLAQHGAPRADVPVVLPPRQGSGQELAEAP